MTSSTSLPATTAARADWKRSSICRQLPHSNRVVISPSYGRPQHPARMQADGKEKVAGALVSQRQERARQRQVEKTGHNLLEIDKPAQHRWEQRETRSPVHFSGRLWLAQKMNEGVKRAADHQRGWPATRFPQRAEYRAAK